LLKKDTLQAKLLNQQSVINFPVTTGKYKIFVDEILSLAFRKNSSIVCVANVHMFIEAYKNQKFLQIINSADLVTPDGRPLIWALQLLHGIKQDRVAGMDLLPDLLHNMAQQNISAYFYGGTQAMLNNTKTYLENKYPTLKIAGLYSPPFGTFDTEDDTEEEKEVISKINAATPSVVFVILGCPKQEKWMASVQNKINTVMIGIGGAVPVMVGMQKRAPLWMQNTGLEWLYRLYQEPVRLFKRYFTTNSLFVWLFLKEFIRLKIIGPSRSPKSSG
jgi:N-acetylglucosaminyldiphosphoundecaprenol N-acetyl-beta-D-mannosaminyltransferase